MSSFTEDLLDLAEQYHRQLPPRIRAYLHGRGIPDELIDLHRLGWNGWRITIPISNRDGQVSFFKLAKDPEDPRPSPKMLSSPGSHLELYGWERVRIKPCRILICEGEFDRLVLEAHGFPTVTSTGGASTFRAEWAEAFLPIPEVYLCFDRDEAGQAGALRVGRLIPHARLVELPPEVGEGGDVTDFFVRLGRSREDFLSLLAQALPVPPAPPPVIPARTSSTPPDPASRERIEHLKAECPIEQVIGQHVILARSGEALRGLCPFHEDHEPSLIVYPEKGSFHCYGCGKHGDVITFLREYEHLSFPEALEALERFTRHD